MIIYTVDETKATAAKASISEETGDTAYSYETSIRNGAKLREAKHDKLQAIRTCTSNYCQMRCGKLLPNEITQAYQNMTIAREESDARKKITDVT